jgi:hypothetical protein
MGVSMHVVCACVSVHECHEIVKKLFVWKCG